MLPDMSTVILFHLFTLTTFTDGVMINIFISVIDTFVHWPLNYEFLLRFPEHDNIVSIYGVIPSQMCIVMEMAEYSLDKVSLFISEYFLCTNISNMKSQVSIVINHDFSKMKYCNMLLILYTASAGNVSFFKIVTVGICVTSNAKKSVLRSGIAELIVSVAYLHI